MRKKQLFEPRPNSTFYVANSVLTMMFTYVYNYKCRIKG